MGARDIDAASAYFRKLTKIGFLLSVGWNALIFALTPLFLRVYALSRGTAALVLRLVLINNIFNGLAYPFAGPLGSGLRAAGDIRFTMIVSVTLTVAARLFFSALFGVWLRLGVVGIAWGMRVCQPERQQVVQKTRQAHEIRPEKLGVEEFAGLTRKLFGLSEP